MEERLCSQCGKPLPDVPYRYQFCPVCRSLYGIEGRSDLTRKNRFATKGRDRVAERLRDGFEMIRDDDP
jgi:predicted amidophosphoribosyltransferase